MLGRQDWVGRRKGASAAVFKDVLAKYLPGLTEDDLRHPDNTYSERFFERLGFSSVDSLDFSDFEKASIVQDLAADLDPALIERFDVIYDGGTCEHIFDLPSAYRNINRMLKPGGVFIAHSPSNNWINHGFYQICPEIVFGFWAQSLGYEVLECVFQPLRPWAARNTVGMSNPLMTGKRPRLKGELPGNVPIILNYVVRKPLELPQVTGAVKQTDYARRWDKEAG